MTTPANPTAPANPFATPTISPALVAEVGGATNRLIEAWVMPLYEGLGRQHNELAALRRGWETLPAFLQETTRATLQAAIDANNAAWRSYNDAARGGGTTPASALNAANAAGEAIAAAQAAATRAEAAATRAEAAATRAEAAAARAERAAGVPTPTPVPTPAPPLGPAPVPTPVPNPVPVPVQHGGLGFLPWLVALGVFLGVGIAYAIVASMAGTFAVDGMWAWPAAYGVAAGGVTATVQWLRAR